MGYLGLGMGIGFATDEEVEEIERTSRKLPLFIGREGLSRDQRLYLNAYMATGKHRRACEVSRINRFYHWSWMQNDPAYQAAFIQIEAGLRGFDIEKIEQRAVDGFDEELSYMGQATGSTVRKYSDTLAKAFLAAHDPRYRDGGVTVNVGPQSLAITHSTGEKSLTIEGEKAPEAKKISQQSHNSSDE